MRAAVSIVGGWVALGATVAPCRLPLVADLTIAAVAFAALVAVWPTVDRWTAGGAS